jgi:hypothetical protein
VTGHRTVRLACVGLLALVLLVAVSASSSAAGDLHISLTANPASPVAGGAAFTVTADVSNSSGTDVNSYTANIVLPSGISFVSTSDLCAPDSGNAQLIVCSRPAIANGGPDDTFSFDASAAPSAAGPATITPSFGSIDPNTVTGTGDGLSLTVDGQADLQPSISAPSGDKIAGDPGGFVYTVTVTNNGASDNHGGYTLTGTLPAYMHWASGGDCSSAANGFTCTNSGGLVATSGSNVDTYHVHVTVDSSACPGAVPGCDGTANASVSVVSNGTTDPPPGDNGAAVDVSIITRANLTVTLNSASPANLYANLDTTKNTVTYSLTVKNNGWSDARTVTITGLPSVLTNIKACRVVPGTPCNNDGDFSAANLVIGTLAGGTVKETADMRVKAQLKATLRALNPPSSQQFTYTAQATSDTQPASMSLVPTDNRTSGSNPQTTTYDTVPSPPKNVQAIPGPTNVIVTWQKPDFTGGHTATAQTISSYVINVAPGGETLTLNVTPTTPTVTCPNGTATCYYFNVGSPPTAGNPALTPGTEYTFDVQARNDVGPSDILDPSTSAPLARAKATPSAQANAQVFGTTANALSTCSVATLAQPTCVSFAVPTGTGGVFGVQGGTSVQLPGAFCGGVTTPCSSLTGSLGIGPLSGYNDRTHPIKETILWDSSTIPASALKANSCGANKTIITCFPNNVTFYDESSAALALGQPSEPMNAPGHIHFCADPTSKGGAGNVNWARPKPYTDSAGSACIQSMTVIQGQPGRDAQKGDVQVVLLFTSDSDITQGKR